MQDAKIICVTNTYMTILTEYLIIGVTNIYWCHKYIHDYSDFLF